MNALNILAQVFTTTTWENLNQIVIVNEGGPIEQFLLNLKKNYYSLILISQYRQYPSFVIAGAKLF